jgi:exosortase family protein XrtF
MFTIKGFINKPFYRFILIAVICYLGWFILYDLWLKQEGSIDIALEKSTTWLVVEFLRYFNYEATYRESAQHLFFFYISGKKILQMVPACSGQVLYPLFIGFIVATPGKIKDKVMISLAGSIVIFIVNAIRVLALCLIKIHAPSYLAFNHKYTFTIIVYGCIFGMWMIWIKYFVHLAKSSQTNE